jgi:GNAT superfamily N-acetyltransferase
MNYEVVKYAPEHHDDVVDLQKHLWSTDGTINSSYLDWKFVHNPYTHEPLIYLLRCRGQIVGMRGFHGAEWQFDQGRRFLAPCAGDLVALPEHRGRGVFRRIMSAAIEDLSRLGYQFVFNLSASPVTYIRSLRSGWQLIAPFQMLRWVTKGTASYSGATPTDQFLRMFDERSAKCSQVSSKISIAKNPKVTAMADLVQITENGNLLRHSRDQEYFDWRYNNPLCRYRFIYWSDPDVRGYLVLQMVHSSLGSGVRLVDWQATNDNIFEELLTCVLRWTEPVPVTIWSVGLTKQKISLLHRLGFESYDESKGYAWYKPGPIVAKIEESNSDWRIAGHDILAPHEWDFRMIYSDYY